jgi:hypothetical protein
MSSLLIILLRPCSTDRYILGRFIGMAREKDLDRKLWPSCRAGCPSGSHLRSACSNDVWVLGCQPSDPYDDLCSRSGGESRSWWTSSHQGIVKDGIFRFRKRVGSIARNDDNKITAAILVLWQLATLTPSRLRQVNLESHNCGHWPRDVSGLTARRVQE